MISLNHISKTYGPLSVLRDISLEIPDGEITTIVGASGAGKTTLLQIAGTLLAPDSGEVVYDSQNLRRLSNSRLAAFRNANIGFIFQFHELLPEFSARENVALPAMIGGTSKKKALAKADELLDLLGLSSRLHHRPAELSGGERQRTAIARALVNDPKIIFADEPTGSLDSNNRQEIQEIIRDLNRSQRRTFLMVTHDSSLAEISHRIVSMADGQILSIRHNG